MQSSFHFQQDLDAIARNLIALDLAHITPEESTDYALELSAIASLNEALEIAATAIESSTRLQLWQRLHPMLSDSAALLSSQLAPLLDLNAERSFPTEERPVERPLALAAYPLS